MSAVHDTMKKGSGGLWRLVRSPCSCPLLSMPLPLIGYVLSVVACYVALFGWELARTPKNASELALFAALMCCGAICIEAARRLGQPTGVTRDLLSAWWLPVALLLPPVYALAAPAVLGPLCYARVRRGPSTGGCSAPRRSGWQARQRRSCSGRSARYRRRARPAAG